MPHPDERTKTFHGLGLSPLPKPPIKSPTSAPRSEDTAWLRLVFDQARSQDFTLEGEAQKLRGCTFSSKKVEDFFVVALKT